MSLMLYERVIPRPRPKSGETALSGPILFFPRTEVGFHLVAWSIRLESKRTRYHY